jgi:site-specific recombinase XerC
LARLVKRDAPNTAEFSSKSGVAVRRLRHIFYSWIAMTGASTREIVEAAGHKTISQAACYSHRSPRHTQSVLDRIAGTGTGQLNMHQNMHQLTMMNSIMGLGNGKTA